MELPYSLLAQCPLFNGIHGEDIPGLLSCMDASVLRVKKGSYLFREGDPANFIGIVLEGTVQVVREDYDGNRSIMANISQGQIFGESFAFASAAQLPVSILADDDSSILLLNGSKIALCCGNACSFHSQLIHNLLMLVATQNLHLHRKLQITSRRTTREKLLEYLRHQAKLQGKSIFTIPFDRQELADYLEVDRTGLSSEISKLRKEGILECEKSTFRLLRPGTAG